MDCISSFGVATPMLREAMGGISEKEGEDLVCATANSKGAVLKVEDIAEAASYLATDESKHVSGLNLVVDGGYNITNVPIGTQNKNCCPNKSLPSSSNAKI